jgi:soluble lytic murein transglycosylase-like protein
MEVVRLTRIFVIMALTGLFHLLNFPADVQAQSPNQLSEQTENTATGKNVVSLTTTDLLSSQDFAPPVTDLPAKRSRFVTPTKGTKSSSEPKLPVERAVRQESVSSNAGKFEISADLMVPAQRPISPPVSDVPVSYGENHSVATGNQRVNDLITQAAARNGIDHHLILAVMKQESSFNPQAISYKGARGLMQLMPATAARFGVRDIFDPAQNIEGGARYLRFLLDMFHGDVELALAGYNAGEHAVARYGNQIPPYRETQDYVRKISAHYARLKNGAYVPTAYVRRPASPTVVPSKKAESEVMTVGATMTNY